MTPVIKSSQIASHPRQLRALGSVNKKLPIEAKPATAPWQQPQQQGQQAENQRFNEAVAAAGKNTTQGEQGGQHICEELFSVTSLLDEACDLVPSTHEEAAVSAMVGDLIESAMENPSVPNAGIGYEQSRQQGWDAGYEMGMQEGLRLGREEVLALQSCNERLAAVTEAISLMGDAWQAELESAAIEIGYAALLRIVGQKAGDRAIVEGMVRAVLEQLPERRLLNIHLAPADHALFHNGEGVLPNLGAVLVADERVSMGGCIVETDAGSLDGRLETRLAELKAVLVEMHHAREMLQ
jgi:flagellar biosynthesis/type III secretory pathway protein FliH